MDSIKRDKQILKARVDHYNEDGKYSKAMVRDLVHAMMNGARDIVEAEQYVARRKRIAAEQAAERRAIFATMQK